MVKLPSFRQHNLHTSIIINPISQFYPRLSRLSGLSGLSPHFFETWEVLLSSPDWELFPISGTPGRLYTVSSGIIIASLSQSLQCLIVAPRLLQNMAKDLRGAQGVIKILGHPWRDTMGGRRNHGDFMENHRKTMGKPWENIQIPSGNLTVSYWKWPFIVDFPIDSMVIFHSYVNVYQRVYVTILIWDTFFFFSGMKLDALVGSQPWGLGAPTMSWPSSTQQFWGISWDVWDIWDI